jgi:hypothetical protein
MTTVRKPRPITPRYASLPLVSLLMKLLGFLTLGFGVAVFLFGIYAMISRGSMAALGMFLLQLFGCVVLSIILIALADLIHVLLDIEDNTRRSADALRGEISGTTPRVSRHLQDQI